MFLENNNYDLKAFKAGATTYAPAYRYWRNILFSFMMKLFTWEIGDIPQKEIEQRLIIYGYAGIVRLKKDKSIIAATINMNGITKYYDEFSNFTFVCPVESGERIKDIDGVVIDNNELRNSTYNIIHHYATMLAHTEVSLVCALVNGRNVENIIAGSEKMAESARQYRQKIYKGEPDVLVDPAFINLDIRPAGTNAGISIKDLYDIRQNLLTSFYEQIGVKKACTKKERMVTDEVSASDGLLKLNIKDMYDARIKACENITKVFGIPASVKCNVDFDDDGNMVEEEKGVSENEN